MVSASPNDQCLNCGYTFQEKKRYCPDCGQENIPSQLPFGLIVRDFFDNYLSWDSKLGKSIVPFLFKPGHLTKNFMDGKRAGFVHPLRLYLVTSLLFFSVLALLPDQDKGKSTPEKPIEITSVDSSSNIKDQVLKDKKIGYSISIKNEGPEWTRLFSLMNSDEKKNQALKGTSEEIDSILAVAGVEPGFLSKRIVRQLIRLNKNSENFKEYVQSRIPVMMFLLVPLFALVVKLFYLKWKKLYVEYLIMVVHIHAFLFFYFSVSELADYFSGSDIASNIGLIVSAVYIYAAQKNIFMQSFARTFLKLLGLGTIYLIMLFTFLVFNFIIGFLVY